MTWHVIEGGGSDEGVTVTYGSDDFRDGCVVFSLLIVRSEVDPLSISKGEEEL